MPIKDFQPEDTCNRCGLRRATRELEERGVSIRLCDDCYWGQEQPPEPENSRTTAA